MAAARLLGTDLPTRSPRQRATAVVANTRGDKLQSRHLGMANNRLQPHAARATARRLVSAETRCPSSRFPRCRAANAGTPRPMPVVCRAQGDDSRSYPAPKRTKQAEKRSQLETLEVDEEELEDFLALEMQSSLDAPPRHYEFVFLVGEKHAAEIPDVLLKMKEQVAELRGKIWRLNDWGMRPLAYKIKKQLRANYFLLNVEVGADKADLLNRFFQKDERVIRHLMTKADKAETAEYPAPVLYSEAGKAGESQEEEDDDEEDEGDEDEEGDEEWEEGEDDDEEGEEEGEEEEEDDSGEDVVQEMGSGRIDRGNGSKSTLRPAIAESGRRG